MATATLPTLDFSHFRHGSLAEREQFGKDLLEAFVHYGFVKIVNHGIEGHMIQDIFNRVTAVAGIVSSRIDISPEQELLRSSRRAES